ncbi:pectate lyase family protein [Actinomadura miaoliensis]|uniref:Pectate lyase domain-containing protein n=1 Tax=Actinomadura miaoliensis TaxID=430685 RepID=A0ABP7VYY2_9ACTN
MHRPSVSPPTSARPPRRPLAALAAAAGAVLAGALTLSAVPASATNAAAPSPAADVRAANVADGFAGVNAWGQNGTTGGAGGQTVDVDTAAEFLSAIANPNPLVIRVNGTISLSGGPMHDVTSNKTIVGVGSNSGITGGGLNIGLPLSDSITAPPANAVKNVVIRNMKITNCPDDCVNVQMFSHHIWIDHNDLSDQSDGALDVKRGSSYVTVSWNRFHDSDKNMLLGHDDDNDAQDVGRLKVTYHHNFFDGSKQRNPRVRFGEPVHLYNNYYLNVTGYGAASQMNAGVMVENNYFDNVEKPTRTDVGGDPGRIVARGNIVVNSEDPIVQRGSVQEPRTYYAYTLDPAANVPSIVRSGAGLGKVGVPTASAATRAAADAAPVGWAAEGGGTTGGAGGATVDVDTASEFLDVVRDSGSHVIRVHGMLSISGMQDVGSDKTIIGVGANSGFTGGGLDVDGVDNVIIRNLNFRDSGDDGVNVTDGSHHVWIDHNDFAGSDDGTVDIKRGSDYVTVSWNRTHDQAKDMLLGHSDGNGGQDRGRLRVTYHHNWFDGTAERHPRVRFGNPVHVFNNYVANADYGAASNTEGGVLAENNHFENVPEPLVIGVYDGPAGSLVERGNVYVNSGAPETGGTVKPIPYSYSLDRGADVKAIVTAGAGTGKM